MNITPDGTTSPTADLDDRAADWPLYLKVARAMYPDLSPESFLEGVDEVAAVLREKSPGRTPDRS